MVYNLYEETHPTISYFFIIAPHTPVDPVGGGT